METEEEGGGKRRGRMNKREKKLRQNEEWGGRGRESKDGERGGR